MKAISLWQPQPGPVNLVKRTIRWGERSVFCGGEKKTLYAGVGYDAWQMSGGNGPFRVKYHDQTRYPHQGWSCVGCPHLVVDVEYHQPHCAHPLYVDLFGCPQSVASRRDFSAPPDCPMLGKKSEAAQRRYRWHIKSTEIFWRYYYDAGLNPHKHGFKVYP